MFGLHVDLQDLLLLSLKIRVTHWTLFEILTARKCLVFAFEWNSLTDGDATEVLQDDMMESTPTTRNEAILRVVEVNRLCPNEAAVPILVPVPDLVLD
ncbi:hypothetical protein M513_04905 [Trichuris suis]|uniref:Uncharacterized protein n=1 Tax=Trichuris suis TaxID=68888 RepID=A0A085MA82_9BILA|nr:hypothetical protein M513_04905 [Trichuris suis]